MRPLNLSVCALAFVLPLLVASAAEASHAVTLVNLSQKDVSTGATIAVGQCASNNEVGIQVSSGSSTCGSTTDYYVQIEIIPTTSTFTGSVTCTGATQNNFKTSCIVKPYPQINCSGLLSGTNYKWRARERTVQGSTGPWTNFGSTGGTDFTTGGISTGVSAGGPYSVTEGAVLTVTAVSAGCSSSTFNWDFDNDGQYDDASGQSATFDTSALGLDGTTTVNIGVESVDTAGTVFTDSTTVAVANVPPTIDSSSFSNGTYDEGTPLPFSVTASDPGPETLTYTWTVTDSTGAVLQTATGASTTMTFSANGVLTVTVDVDDGEATISTSDTLTVDNLPPEITSTPSTDATEGVLYTYQVVATDPGNDTLTHSLFTFPTGMTIDSSGYVQWMPTYLQVGGNTVRIIVSDGDGAADEQLFSITVIFIDDDNDGMSDIWEVENGFDPTDAGDASADPDGDGRPNLQEYQEGTDPNGYDGPGVPTLIEPVDWAEITVLRPALRWLDSTHPLGDSVTHDVEVYSDEDLNELVSSTTGYVGDGGGEGLWALSVDLVENGRYWWRVRGVDDYVGGPWADGIFFVSLVNDPPPTPTLLYPVGGELVDTTLPTLQWADVEDIEFDAVTYHARVWDETGENLVAEFGGEAEARDQNWTVEIGLEEDGLYSWEVRAIDEHGAASEWSDPEEFRASAFNDAPAEVEWVSPEDDSEFDERSPTLVITSSVDPEGQAITYEFLIDERATFDSPDLVELTTQGPADEDGNISLDLSLEDIDVTLPDGNDFWARARAVDSDGMGSSWTQISFHVNRRQAEGGNGNARSGCGANIGSRAAPLGAGALALLLAVAIGRRRRA
jgi:hypothetical protein